MKHVKISIYFFIFFIICFFVGKEYFSYHPEIELNIKLLVAYIIVIGMYLSIIYFAVSMRNKSFINN
jgi:hypothetical protein